LEVGTERGTKAAAKAMQIGPAPRRNLADVDAEAKRGSVEVEQRVRRGPAMAAEASLLSSTSMNTVETRWRRGKANRQVYNYSSAGMISYTDLSNT